MATPDTTASVSAAPNGTASVFPTTDGTPGAAVPQLRDAFAVLQATYNDNCGTPDCEYFLNSLLTNLDDLDNSMGGRLQQRALGAAARVDQPVAAHARHGRSYPSLKRHRAQLTHTRDEINTWMQSHPGDYR